MPSSGTDTKPKQRAKQNTCIAHCERANGDLINWSIWQAPAPLPGQWDHQCLHIHIRSRAHNPPELLEPARCHCSKPGDGIAAFTRHKRIQCEQMHASLYCLSKHGTQSRGIDMKVNYANELEMVRLIN